MLVKVENDNYFIAQRLKEIDNSYYLIFNTITNKYEVHSYSQSWCSYCLSSEDEGLDERLIIKARKTRKENLDELLKEIDKANEILKEQELKRQKQKVEELLWQ